MLSVDRAYLGFVGTYEFTRTADVTLSHTEKKNFSHYQVRKGRCTQQMLGPKSCCDAIMLSIN